MFGLFKKKAPPADGRGSATPAPLDGRDGHVGGIESIALDGATLYFGFDYSNDLVVSPLIDDVETMARFATAHMSLRDGPRDTAYWREAAGYPSQLCSDEARRTFDSEALAATAAAVRRAAAADVPLPGLTIGYHLRYLLAAAGGWTIDAEAAEDAEECIGILSGQDPLPEGYRYADIATEIIDYLAALVDAAPPNWSTRFAMLKD